MTLNDRRKVGGGRLEGFESVVIMEALEEGDGVGFIFNIEL